MEDALKLTDLFKVLKEARWRTKLGQPRIKKTFYITSNSDNSTKSSCASCWKRQPFSLVCLCWVLLLILSQAPASCRSFPNQHTVLLATRAQNDDHCFLIILLLPQCVTHKLLFKLQSFCTDSSFSLLHNIVFVQGKGHKYIWTYK